MIAYEDFDLRVHADGDGLAVVAQLGSQTASEPFKLDPALAFELDDLAMHGASALRQTGADLFDALFHGKVRLLYHEGRGRSGREAARGLRIRILIDARDARLLPLLRLPWEIVFDATASTSRLLALDALRPIVRVIDSTNPPLATAAEPFERVLLALANPRGYERLDLDRERAKVETALVRNDVRPVIVRPAARLALCRSIWDYEPQLVHFMGHGDLDRSRGEGVLILEDEHGDADVLDASTFAGFFVGRKAPQLVVLTSCLTALPPREGELSAFSSVAAALVSAGLPAVIAMQSEVRDSNAILFTERLYGGLLRREPIEAAVAEARLAVHGVDAVTLDWAAPVLFMRSGESVRSQPAAEPPRSSGRHHVIHATNGTIVIIGDEPHITQDWNGK